MLNILNVAQSGLRVSQAQVENVSNNLANEHTVGYKKRDVIASELGHSDSRLTGRGVWMDGVSRATNVYMYQNLIREDGKLNDMKKLDSMLDGIESIFHETDNTGLSTDLNNYFRSVENLRTNPSNEVYKNDMKSSAGLLMEDLKRIYADIENQEKMLKTDTKKTVSYINSILRNIGDISQQIQLSNGSPNDLLDKRDQLELELAKYVDVEISRESTYELKIAGKLAVRFDTNVHELNLIEKYTPQKDIYTQINAKGGTYYDTTGSPVSNIVNKNSVSWDGTNNASEEQTVKLSGSAERPVYFLGTAVTGSVVGDSSAVTRNRITADTATIIANWNDAHPDQEIETIENGTTAEGLKITYKSTEGDMGYLKSTQSNGITFAQSVETTKGYADSVTYTLDNTDSIKASYGDEVYDKVGAVVYTVDNTNIIKSLVYEINHDVKMNKKVVAYNGPYELAEDGSKILTNDSRHSLYDAGNPNKDRYLVVESLFEGEKGSFTGEILVNDDSNPTAIKEHISINKNDSMIAEDDIHLEIFEEELTVKAGSLKSMLNNIDTKSNGNLFNDYKEKLDNLAKALVDMSNTYIENDNGSYVFGTNAVETNKDEDKRVNINLFTGADVKSLTFNANVIGTLSQEKLDYLAQLQWKKDIDFDGSGENKASFSEFYQFTRVKVADDKENINFKKENQAAVKESLQSSYEKITKVDKDEEMLDLIKFQAAYSANAKVITTLNEMLQTLLNLKR